MGKRIAIAGWPRAGKSTFAEDLAKRHKLEVKHTDDLIGKFEWSELSEEVSRWFDEPGDWIIEGMAVPRALRKWRERNPGAEPPIDMIFVLREPFEELSPRQAAMGKQNDTVLTEIKDWIRSKFVLRKRTLAGDVV